MMPVQNLVDKKLSLFVDISSIYDNAGFLNKRAYLSNAGFIVEFLLFYDLMAPVREVYWEVLHSPFLIFLVVIFRVL